MEGGQRCKGGVGGRGWVGLAIGVVRWRARSLFPVSLQYALLSPSSYPPIQDRRFGVSPRVKWLGAMDSTSQQENPRVRHLGSP